MDGLVNFKSSKDCCGCTACASKCPVNAIAMIPDAFGFLYPKIDTSKCIKCNLCEKVCSFNDKYETNNNINVPILFGARNKDIGEIETSRSGAVFVAIAEHILNEGGVVYGAYLKGPAVVVHKRITIKDEIKLLKGSKYIQSNIVGIFNSIEEDLRKGTKVLFTGTPCQTSALNSFIKKDMRKNLLLLDIICHGVASPKVWKDYLLFLENKENDTIINANFRDKSICGWDSHKESFLFSKMNCKKMYDYLFYESNKFRLSCFNCPFANTVRPSDITLGDFWNIEKNYPDFFPDDKGVNIVFCNTQKGIDVFNNIKDKLNYFKTDISKALQPNLQHPTIQPQTRIRFERDYALWGFKYVFYMYGNVGWIYGLKQNWQHFRDIIHSYKLRLFKICR